MALALERAPRRAMFDDGGWAADVPAALGVYALWNLSSGEMIYVGETASLRHRMRDLGRSVNNRKSIVNSPGRRLLTGTAYSWVKGT